MNMWSKLIVLQYKKNDKSVSQNYVILLLINMQFEFETLPISTEKYHHTKNTWSR